MSAPDDVRRLFLQRRLIEGLIGRKISLSTTDQHFLVGQLEALGSDDRLKILVKDHEVYVRRTAVARIHAADPALADFIK